LIIRRYKLYLFITAGELSMEAYFYKNLIEESSFGYAFHRLILNEKNEPADYEFIEVNTSYENLTGLKRENILGKRVTEIISVVKEYPNEWVKFYGQVILNNECRTFEHYSETLDRWYKVQVSPEKNLCFVTMFFDITDLKKTEIKLTEITDSLVLSRSRFVQYMKYAPDGIFIAGRDGRYLAVNPAACTLLGYTRDELLMLSIPDILPPETMHTGLDGLNNLLEKGHDQRETSLLRKDGGRVWVSLDSVILPDGTVMAFCKDITERKKNERQLLEYSLFNRTLINTIPAPVYFKDIKGKYLGINSSFADFYGVNETDLIGKTVYDIAPRDIADFHTERDAELLKNPDIQIYEVQLLDLRDELHDVIFNKAVFNDINGDIGGIIGVILDITDRKKTEKELNLYFRAIQSIDQPLLITDSKGDIKRVNNAFLKMYGYTVEELKGNNPRVLNPGKSVYLNFGYTEEEYDELFKSMWRDIADPELGTWEGVLINRKKDGSFVWVNILINAVYNEDHTQVNYIALPVDISGTVQNEAKTKIQLYQTIAALAELRDNETGNHMRRVGIYTKLIARELNMPEKDCNDIEIFAPLHDIGKVGILDSLLLAERKLTKREFEIMKTHTTLGYNIVKGKKELEMVAAVTMSHHEWYDGSGYPEGIYGEQIPLSARITAVADVYDALRSRRPYKHEWSHDESKKYIIENSGKQFDPEIVAIFKNISDRFESIYHELKD
jgi:PAS domain S-box-containing protein